MMPQLVFVIADPSDPNAATHTELGLTNHLMTMFPGQVFLSRATFIMTELFAPRPDDQWALFYRSLIECCDAIYCHDGFERHPLVEYAFDCGLAVLHDTLDLGLWLTSVEAEESNGS